jgi:hypothetical protein
MRSEWVKMGIAKARKREIRESRRMLFSALVDFETLRDWECSDADTGKALPSRSVNTSSQTSADGKSIMMLTRRLSIDYCGT